MMLMLACTVRLLSPCVPGLSTGTAEIARSQAMHSSLCTPLHAAARCNNLETARYLVDMGADKERKDGWGYTPAELAGNLGPFPKVELLLNGSQLRIGSLVVD